MEPVDLIALAKTSQGARNAHLARSAILPACSRKFPIERGPSLPSVCSAPATALPYDLSKALHLHRKSKNPLVEDHLPVQFKLKGERVGRFGDCEFSVAVYVRSVDLEPDLDQLHWSLFGHAIPSQNCHLYFSPRSIIIRGWFQVIGDGEYAPEDLRKVGHRECVIAYDPQQGKGWLGEVSAVQELPSAGVIKDLDVFWGVVRERYAGGFIEEQSPQGVSWGRLSGGGHSVYPELYAYKKDNDAWKYFSSDNRGVLRLSGVTKYSENSSIDVLGDMFLCSDGTILHTYHFSHEHLAEKGYSAHAKEWEVGHYSNRFYPPESPVVPKNIADSFESEMPAWFYKEEEKRKAKSPKLA